MLGGSTVKAFYVDVEVSNTLHVGVRETFCVDVEVGGAFCGDVEVGGARVGWFKPIGLNHRKKPWFFWFLWFFWI